MVHKLMLYAPSNTTQKFRSSLFKGLRGRGADPSWGLGAQVSGGHRCAAAAPTEPTGEIQRPNIKRLAEKIL